MAVIPLAKENYTAIARYLPQIKLTLAGFAAKRYVGGESSKYKGQIIHRKQTFTGFKRVKERKFLRLNR